MGVVRESRRRGLPYSTLERARRLVPCLGAELCGGNLSCLLLACRRSSGERSKKNGESTFVLSPEVEKIFGREREMEVEGEMW